MDCLQVPAPSSPPIKQVRPDKEAFFKLIVEGNVAEVQKRRADIDLSNDRDKDGLTYLARYVCTVLYCNRHIIMVKAFFYSIVA